MTSRLRLFPAQTLGAGLATGLLLALGYAPIGWSPVAFVAFAPLLLALESLADEARAGRPAKARAFGAGWAAGLVLYVWLLWWIVVLDSPTLTIPWVRWLAPFLIAAFMALYWGLASLAYVFVRARTRVPAYVIAPAAFTVMELVRGRGELGFPWGEIGYTQVAFLPSLQFAAVAGVSGVGLWVVATGALVALGVKERRGRRVFLAVLLAVGPIVWGAYRLASATDRGPSIRVALVQPNVRNDEKWLPENREAIFEELAELSREGVRQGAEIVLWPETAAPCYLLKDGRWLPYVQALADSLDVPMFLGTTDYEIVQEGNERWVTYSNAGVLFDRQGELTGRMDKIRLVPFGEYVPFSHWIPWLRKVDFGEADFERGTGPVLFRPEGLAPFAALVCLEAVFPDLVRQEENLGAEWLANITNDSWFGAGSGAVLHRDMAATRCVETGCGMARCANSGISVAIDPWGRRSGETGLFEDAVSVVDVRLRQGRTPYAAGGDWATRISVLVLGLALLAAAVDRRFARHSSTRAG